MEENVNKNALSSEPTGLLKEIVDEIDCRDKVREYLDSKEIPDRFFACMFGELVKIFGIDMIKPDSHSEYSYKDRLDEYLVCQGGTGGWYGALKITCWILDMEWLLNVYERLSWMNSDYFDEWVGDKIVEYLFEKDNYRDQDYAEFLKKKGVL